MWYSQTYFNRRDWLLSHFNKLNVTADQFLLLCIIDSANQSNIDITNEYLREKTKQSASQLDKNIQALTQKNYLKIKFYKRKIDFNIDGVFRKEFQDDQLTDDFLRNIEESFGRLLSQQELHTLTQLRESVEQSVIEYAIRQAVLNNKLSMSYIEKVALNESNQNDA